MELTSPLPAIRIVGRPCPDGGWQTELFGSGPIVNQTHVNTKKILITTESHEVFILRTDTSDHAYGHCRDCGREVEILTLDQAITYSGIRTGHLIRLTEANRVHSIETSMGHLLVCKESLDQTSSEKEN